MRKRYLLFIILFLFFSFQCNSQSYANLVANVNSIGIGGTPGPLFPIGDAVPIVSGGGPGSVYVLAATYGAGRVVAVGHEGLFSNGEITKQDNYTFSQNVINWLKAPNSRTVAGFGTGHSEWLNNSNATTFTGQISSSGLSVAAISGSFTASNLSNKAFVVIGNAWGTITASEINALTNYVANGGSLLLLGLGWSYNGNDYPMNAVGTNFGIQWNNGYLSPPFTDFYPNTGSFNLNDACNYINQTTTTYSGTLGSTIQNNATIRTNYLNAHTVLKLYNDNFPPGSMQRQEVYDCYKNLIQNHSWWYSRQGSYPIPSESTMAWVRERAHRSFADAKLHTPAVKSEVASTLALYGLYLDVWNEFDLLLADNTKLDATQSAYVYDILTKIPPVMLDLGLLSFKQNLGDPPIANNGAIPSFLTGTNFSINAFNFPIGTYNENQFPQDISPGNAYVFCSTVAHELNHIVESHYIRNNPVLEARRLDLINQAGNDSLNYLRSMIPSGFFVTNPQEFVASISNQWFTDTRKVLELGLQRFDAGRSEPINQFVFMADVYSLNSDSTIFYTMDHPTCILNDQKMRIYRNNNNHITGITVDNAQYTFQVDANGNVLGYTINYLPPRIYVNLEGAYDVTTGIQSMVLRQKNLLPNNQPYHVAPWNYFGTETVASFFATTVDWLLVSFRSGVAANTEVTSTVALLQSSGALYFPNTSFMADLAAENYYILIEHRNHMAVLSPTPIPVKYVRLTYDFRLENGYNSGGSGQRQLSNGEWAMFAGDGDQLADPVGYDINGLDHSGWLPQNGLFNVYGLGDYNLDADITGADKLLWSGNNGVFSNVPK